MCDYKYKLTCMRVASDSSQSFRVYCRMNQLKTFLLGKYCDSWKFRFELNRIFHWLLLLKSTYSKYTENRGDPFFPATISDYNLFFQQLTFEFKQRSKRGFFIGYEQAEFYLLTAIYVKTMNRFISRWHCNYHCVSVIWTYILLHLSREIL